MEPADADDGDPARNDARLLKGCLPLLLLLPLACVQETGRPALKAGTTAVAEKNITLLAAGQPASRPEKKYIYLTFDDGPNRGTRAVYETFRELEVPVSFFIVGRHVTYGEEQRRLFDSIAAHPQMEVCNHSFGHAANHYTKFYADSNGVIADFFRADSLLRPANRIARMPGRNAWRIGSVRATDVPASKPAIDAVARAGFRVMGWDIEWAFDHQTLAPDADTALLLRRMQNLLADDRTHTPGHLVLLAHDQAFYHEADLALLRGFLKTLREQPGWELVLASRYPGLP